MLEKVSQQTNAGEQAKKSQELFHKGLSCWNEGKKNEAYALLKEAYSLKPDELSIRLLFAEILMSSGNPNEAQKILEATPNEQRQSPFYLCAKLKLLLIQEKNEEAIDLGKKILLDFPSDPLAHSLYGRALRRIGNLPEALKHAQEAIRLYPNEPTYHNNLAVVLQELGNIKESIHHYRIAWQLNPNYASAKMREGLMRLLIGDWAEGWNLYEFRLGANPLAPLPGSTSPIWTPDQPIVGKAILLRAEQGIGDTLQFLRYASRIAKMGADVILEVQPPLYRLLKESNLSGVKHIIAQGHPLPPHHFQCPLLSLGQRLNLKPTKKDCSQGAYLNRNSMNFSPNTKLKRVAVCWAGNPAHLNQINRSIPLNIFSKILSIPEIQFVSLQKNVSETEKQILNQFPNIINLEEQLSDFAVTADALLQTDLLISIDTSIAHLAGALGFPTWLLLPKVPDWRWGLKGETCLWYPNTRLIRQDKFQNWHEVIELIYYELKEILKY
ncbi:MAG: tetratricopeptide repeat protein [Chthoniobacterales bacterium]|nr:tetratricopeptide repeat protein [Chthoniobacterales bacterium]